VHTSNSGLMIWNVLAWVASKPSVARGSSSEAMNGLRKNAAKQIGMTYPTEKNLELDVFGGRVATIECERFQRFIRGMGGVAFRWKHASFFAGGTRQNQLRARE
jgi:hypothetical protein